MPKGGFIIGGAARSAIQQMLGEEVIPPRDIDIVGIEEFGAVHEDFRNFAHSVVEDKKHDGESAKVEQLSTYIGTRDFTINEVLVGKNQCIATAEALKDLAIKIIRPTQFESGQYENYKTNEYGVSPKLVMKAIRLREEFKEMYGKGQIEGIEDWQFEAQNIPLFYIALHLDRAIDRGDKIAQRFYAGLLKAGTISQDDDYEGEYIEERLTADDPYELARKLSLHFIERSQDNRYNSPFLFTREDLNVTSKEDLERHQGLNPPKLPGRNDKYANMAEDYIGRKNIKNEGFDGWSNENAVRTITSKQKSLINEQIYTDTYYADEEPGLNAIEAAFWKVLQDESYPKLKHKLRK